MNRLLVTLARRVDPGFLWLEVVDRDAPAAAGEPSTTGELGGSRFVRFEEPLRGFRPGTAPKLDAMIGEGETTEGLRSFREFLQLAEPVQELVGRVRRGKGPRVLAVANADRVFAHREDKKGRLREALAALTGTGTTLLASACGGPRADRFDFVNVYRLTTPHGRPWSESLIEAEQGALTDRRLGGIPIRSLVPFAREFASG